MGTGAAWFAPGNSRCQQFARQSVQMAHGHRFDFYHRGSAHESAMEWRHSIYARDPKRGSLPGDLLYWFARGQNRWGHVAVRVPGNGIVENSTIHWPRNHGKRYRKLAQLPRPPDLVVRLPAARLELTPQGLRRLWQISPVLPES